MFMLTGSTGADVRSFFPMFLKTHTYTTLAEATQAAVDLINHDVNGAYQIIRKVFSDVKFNQFDKEIVGCVSNPVKYNIY